METKGKVESGEWPSVILSFMLYFCVLGGYFAVRPVRETIGTILGGPATADLYKWTWVFSLLIVPAYGYLCTVLKRQTMLTVVYALIAVAIAVTGAVFSIRGERSLITGKCFFVMISVLNLFVVSVFWSFVLEIFDPAQSKRLFGIIAAGGTTGALFGPYVTGLFVRTIGNAGVLYFGSALFLCAIVLQFALIRIRRRTGGAAENTMAAGEHAGHGEILLRSFNGVLIVMRSPYLIGIATFVFFIAAVNTFLYFRQQELVIAAFSDSRDRTAFFSNMDSTVQGITVILQVLATGRIASRFGVGVLLTALPLLMIAGMTLLAVVNTLSVLAVVYCARRIGEYAFIRPGREMLFSPLDTETKYKAKNFIDVPVYRGSDWLNSQLNTAANQNHWKDPALIAAGFAVIWAVNGWWLGRRHSTRSAKPAPP